MPAFHFKCCFNFITNFIVLLFCSICFIIFLTLGNKQQFHMKNNRSQTFKNHEVQPPVTQSKLRAARQSQPNIMIEDVQLQIKNVKENYKQKHVKQGRASEVVSPGFFTDNFHSPKSRNLYQHPRTGFMSPTGTKYPKAITKCTSYENLNKQGQISKFTKKNKQVLDQTKTKTSLIQSHKQALNKIQQMLSSHGIQIAKGPKQKKQVEEHNKKPVKSPRFSQNLIPQHQIQMLRKESQSFGNQKKTNNQRLNQSHELKQTMSTSSTFKNVRQLKISDFQLGKQLGRGRFGIVKVARHKKTSMVFALKIIKKSLVKQEQIIEQLIKEIKIQYYLNHANIIKLYGVFDDTQNCYLLMEMCCQGNLYQLMIKNHHLTQSQTKAILKDICEGLAQLHYNKIIHRDLKPENIVMSFGMGKICDFGWSTQNKDTLRETFCGTPLYVSPQLLSGNSYDEKVDLWSIGILGYEMMTGKIPFDIRSQKDLTKIINSKIVFPKTMSAQAISFLEDILCRDPKNRKDVIQLLHHKFFQKKK